VRQCKLCSNVNKVEDVDVTNPAANKCFEKRRVPEQYQPVPRKRGLKITLTCQNFAHVRSMRCW